MSFGSRIVNIRKKQHLSQSELALRIGLHANVLGRYERNEALPSIEIASKIAKALNVSLDYLSGLSDLELDSVVLSRIKEIGALPEDDRDQLFKVIDALIRDHKASKTSK